MGRGKCDPPYYEEAVDEVQGQGPQGQAQPRRGATILTWCFLLTSSSINISVNVAFIGFGHFCFPALERDANEKFKKLPENEQTPERRNKLVNDTKTIKAMGIDTLIYLALALLVLAPLLVLLKKKNEKLIKYHSRIDLSFFLVGLILSFLYFFILQPDAYPTNEKIFFYFVFAHLIFFRALGIYFLERYRHRLLLPEGQEVGLGRVDGLIVGLGLMAEDGARAVGSTEANVQVVPAPAPEGDQNNTSSS